MTALSKTKINTTFVSIDGTIGVRSYMDDISSVRARVFARLKAIDEVSANLFVIPAINAYNDGAYEEALSHFQKSVAENIEFKEELRPHVNICQRVIRSITSQSDAEYRRACSRWKRLPFFIKWLWKGPLFKIRCKYCGHFSKYIDPEVNCLYMGMNYCDHCGRGYPMPDFAWDGIGGQAYIYYRHSVVDEEFYREFEAQFDVEVDHTVFDL